MLASSSAPIVASDIFYAACHIDELSRGSISGPESYSVMSKKSIIITSKKFCFVSVFVFHSKLLPMATARAIGLRHLPDGGIQWLLVKPGMCSIGQCALLHHRIPMAMDIASKVGVFFCIVNFVIIHNLR
jgi:hypothetical protein